jgi:hypothetical protein
LQERSRLLDQQEQTQRDINGVLLIAAQYGADASTLSRIQNATTYEDAIASAGSALQDPKARYELESARLDNILKQEQIAQTRKETALIGEPSAADQKAAAAAIANAKASIPVMQDKISAIDALLTSPGLTDRVGTSIYSRAPSSLLGGIGRIFAGAGNETLAGIASGITGSGQNFAASVHQLTSGLTLDNLINAKARGATFGALSEGELAILADSATKLSDWEIKDKNGKGTGFWNIDEQSFKTELKTIQDLTRRAIYQSGSSIFTPDEQAQLDQIGNLSNSLPQSGTSFY